MCRRDVLSVYNCCRSDLKKLILLTASLCSYYLSHSNMTSLFIQIWLSVLFKSDHFFNVRSVCNSSLLSLITCYCCVSQIHFWLLLLHFLLFTALILLVSISVHYKLLLSSAVSQSVRIEIVRYNLQDTDRS